MLNIINPRIVVSANGNAIGHLGLPQISFTIIWRAWRFHKSQLADRASRRSPIGLSCLQREEFRNGRRKGNQRR